MNSLQALQDQSLFLPKAYDDISFLDFVKDSLSKYLQVIESINEGEITKTIQKEFNNFKDLCDELIESYNQLYLGHPYKSYYHFEKGMSKIEEYLAHRPVTHPLSESRLLFRGRTSDSKLTKEEMFHLPFQLRHLATTQRFSIPGLPCLYLANSSYVCWEELNRPDFSKFYVSRYLIREYDGYMNLRTLDISQTPQRITKMINTVLEHASLDSWDKLFMDYFAKWPLIFCCSIKVKYENATFKPEYIVPQYLLQWIKENRRLNSIKYFSVKTNLNQNTDFSGFTNVVIPVQENKPYGHCKFLRDTFEFTEPVSLNDFKVSTEIPQEDISNYIQTFNPNPAYLLNSLKEIGDDYLRSAFGRSEIFLCTQKTD